MLLDKCAACEGGSRTIGEREVDRDESESDDDNSAREILSRHNQVKGERNGTGRYGAFLNSYSLLTATLRPYFVLNLLISDTKF